MSTVANGTLHHTCFLVHDVVKTAQQMADTLGIKPWSVFTLEPPECFVRGKETKFTFRVALAEVGGASYELLQPVSGDSVYVEHMEKHGESFHHTCIAYASHEDMQAAKAELLGQGREMIQNGGAPGAFEFCYFDMAETGSVLELLWLGELPPPEKTIE
jgi:hypothetical protein